MKHSLKKNAGTRWLAWEKLEFYGGKRKDNWGEGETKQPLTLGAFRVRNPTMLLKGGWISPTKREGTTKPGLFRVSINEKRGGTS